jgi:uncharacterized protein YecT (DUF1311 family)
MNDDPKRAGGGMRVFAAAVFLPVLVLISTASAEVARKSPGAGNAGSCNDAADTLSIVACIQGETAAWDRRLNAAYAALKKRIDSGQQEPLLAAQRLWIQYRDANCRFYGSQEGTIRQIQAAECLKTMTRDRATELERAMKFE